MSFRKIIPVTLMIVAACLALAACMNNGANNAQPTPEPTADFAPGATDNGAGAAQNGNGAVGPANNGAGMINGGATNNNGTGNTSAATGGALTPFDWANGAANVEKAIGQISEISDARVVVTNTTALVGVKFDGAYKGELTERIREMVAAEVLKADSGIQTVAVTSVPEDVQKVYELSDAIRSGRTADELSADINAIVRNATTLR